MRLALLLIVIGVVAANLPIATATAASCVGDGAAAGQLVTVHMNCVDEPRENPGAPGTSPAASTSAYIAYQWVSACQRLDAANPQAGPMDCVAARACPDPLERQWLLYGQRPNGSWDPLDAQCFGRPPGPADTPRPPQVGPDDVLTALRRIGLPALEAKTQPADKTLVNFETIFYAEPQTFARTLTLLGQRVEVEATPTAYTWHHGDGTSTQTSTPGARYPAKEVVHEYTDAQVTVSPSVDVTYSARFRVNGGAWQEIPETVTISGPQGSLRIAEATAVLSGQYD